MSMRSARDQSFLDLHRGYTAHGKEVKCNEHRVCDATSESWAQRIAKALTDTEDDREPTP